MVDSLISYTVNGPGLRPEGHYLLPVAVLLSFLSSASPGLPISSRDLSVSTQAASRTAYTWCMLP